MHPGLCVVRDGKSGLLFSGRGDTCRVEVQPTKKRCLGCTLAGDGAKGLVDLTDFRIDDLELASRLSFFLWSSIPDDELLEVASRGQLRNPAVLDRQVRRMLAERGDWPLHLGVTEAGPAFQGTIKSSTAFGILLGEGIGDTIRVSLSAPPAEEVKVGLQILQSLNLRERKLEIVSCPSCGRAQVDVYKLANDVTAGLEGMTVPLRVAVMGCVVNGPGEAREADLGVASGNGKGQIFVKGEVIKTVPESEIVATLIEEANRMAAEMDPTLVGSPQVVVAQK